jgi:hypothetical protein
MRAVFSALRARIPHAASAVVEREPADGNRPASRGGFSPPSAAVSAVLAAAENMRRNELIQTVFLALEGGNDYTSCAASSKNRNGLDGRAAEVIFRIFRRASLPRDGGSRSA